MNRGTKRERERDTRAPEKRAARGFGAQRDSYIIGPAGVRRAGVAPPGARRFGARSYPRLRHGIMPGFIITKLTKNPNDDAP